MRASRTGNRNHVRSRPSGQTIVEARIYCDMDLLEVIAMMTAKLVADGGSQAVLLPEGCRLDGDEVYVNRIGDAVVLAPKNNGIFASMLAAADSFADDFMEGVKDLPLQERESALRGE